MKHTLDGPDRMFRVSPDTMLKDCGEIGLDPNEQVTFTTPAGGQHDVVRKEWGFYATGSLNARLPDHRLHPVLVRNAAGRWYVLLIERDCERLFSAYIEREGLTLVCRLDDEAVLESIAKVCLLGESETQ